MAKTKKATSKPKQKPAVASNASKKTSKSAQKKQSSFANAPIFDLLYNFQKAPHQWAARYILILSAIIMRSAVGLGPFSGYKQKPINGDFEAQRHWMELTTNLPINQWYFFDLQYWGLDYPPLTAYHSYICGKIGSLINSSWFELGTSRGLESNSIKNYMRFTSLISEMLIYAPALLGIISFIGKKLNISRIDQIVISCIIMCQPALILIDHGHFQYNSVMLGLFLFSLLELLHSNYNLAAIWFMSSVFFKQMALYYSPFIFFYILAKLLNNRYDFDDKKVSNLMKKFNWGLLFSVGASVGFSSVAFVSPFVLSFNLSQSKANLAQIVHRVFPFARGLFEDKVANFWCTTNLVIKYRNIFTNDQLTKLALALTLASVLPPSFLIFYKHVFGSKFSKTSTSKSKYMSLIFGFAACSWGFYLFSFQVHEKSVLVPLVPSTLLYLLNDHYYISITQWINNIATFSMYPLLKKDGLTLQYVVMLALINWLVGGFSWKNNLLFQRGFKLWNIVFAFSYILMIAYHIIDYGFLPPARYPDLWVIVNTTISFGCFALYYLWLLFEIYML